MSCNRACVLIQTPCLSCPLLQLALLAKAAAWARVPTGDCRQAADLWTVCVAVDLLILLLFVWMWAAPGWARPRIGWFTPEPRDVFCFDCLSLLSLTGLLLFAAATTRLFAQAYYAHCLAQPDQWRELAIVALVAGIACALVPALVFGGRIVRRTLADESPLG